MAGIGSSFPRHVPRFGITAGIGLDSTVYLPCAVADWGPPFVPTWPASYTQANTLLLTSATHLPFTQVDQSNPQRQPGFERSFVNQFGLMQSGGGLPFTQVDRSNPRSVTSNAVQNWVQAPFFGIGIYYLPSLVTGWPPPDVPTPRDLSWSNRSPLAVDYVFRDPFICKRWPLQYDAGIHSWVGIPGALRTPVSPKPPGQAEASNPRLPVISNAVQNWTQSSYFGVPTYYFPSIVTVWSLPEVRPQPIALQNWIQSPPPVAAAAPPSRPFTQADQSNPQRLSLAFPQWTGSASLALTAKPPAGPEWSIPRQAPVWLRDWINQSNALLAAPPGPKPFTQIDQSNPRLPVIGNAAQNWAQGSYRGVGINFFPGIVTNWSLPEADPRAALSSLNNWVGRTAGLLAAVSNTIDLNVVEANDTLLATATSAALGEEGGRYRRWPIKGRRKLYEEELEELEAFLKAVAESQPVSPFETKPAPFVTNYHGPLASAFYAPRFDPKLEPQRIVQAAKGIVRKAKVEEAKQNDDEEAVLLYLNHEEETLLDLLRALQ
jgi:hypothetical protein